LARAALQTRVDFEAKTAGGRGVGVPRRHDEELLADFERRPFGLHFRGPIDLRRRLWIPEARGCAAILKPGFEVTGAFADAQGSGFPQFRDQRVLRLRFGGDAHDKHQPCTRAGWSRQNRSRSWCLRILPVPVFGSGPAENSMILGSLNLARRPRKNSVNSSAVS